MAKLRSITAGRRVHGPLHDINTAAIVSSTINKMHSCMALSRISGSRLSRVFIICYRISATSPSQTDSATPKHFNIRILELLNFEILLYHIVYIYMIRFSSTAASYVTDFNFLYIMFVFLFLCIYTNPATGCYMNKTILLMTGDAEK